MYKIGDIITYGRNKQKMIITAYDKTNNWIQFKDKEQDKDYHAFYLEDTDIKKIKIIKELPKNYKRSENKPINKITQITIWDLI